MIDHRRYTTTDYPGLLGSFLASWILHCILYAIAVTTTVFYPPVADREMISVDLLFASSGSGSPELSLQEIPHKPSLQSEEMPSVNDIKVAATPVQTAQSDTLTDSNEIELLTVAKPEIEKKKAPSLKVASPPPLPKKVQKEINPPPSPIIIPAAEKTPEPEIKEAAKPLAPEVINPPVIPVEEKTLEQSEKEKLAIENEKTRRLQEAEQKLAEERAFEEARRAKIASAAELEKHEAEKAARSRLAAEKEKTRLLQKAANERSLEEARAAKIAKAAELKRLESEKAVKAKLAAEKAKKELEAAEKARIEQLARLRREAEIADRGKLANERAVAEKAAKDRLDQARLAATNVVAAAAATPEKPTINTPTADTRKNLTSNGLELKGLALPPVPGEIKLIITSEEDLLVKVLFVSHPKARHDRPLTKKEAKEQQKINPVIVRTAKNTLEAIIERSDEGVYIFLVEQKGSKPVTAKFSLKLFETKNKSVTGREISGQTEVARLLMPEGIIWEDDSAFSGNIEDSDSVTKFNSDTGLVWKEYRK